MADQMIINNDDSETVEISTAEYEAIIGFSAKIAEQNALVLGSNAATQDAIKAMTTALADVKGAIADAVSAAVSGLTITVNVPEQPAPQITVQPAAVNIEMPKPKSEKQTIKRNKGSGLIESTETKIEY